VADQLVNAGLKSSTMKTYATAQRSFVTFCETHGLCPVPSSDATLILYVAHLFSCGLKGSSIKVYLAGVRNLHVARGIDFPAYSPKLQLALKGSVNLSDSPNRKMPITFPVLACIVEILIGRHDELMLKSAMSLAFFGCFRAGELCLPDHIAFDPLVHLTCGDIQIFELGKYMTITLKQSKTDVQKVGVTVHVGCSGNSICAFCYMLSYVHIH
jgi:hypothetical protein